MQMMIKKRILLLMVPQNKFNWRIAQTASDKWALWFLLLRMITVHSFYHVDSLCLQLRKFRYRQIIPYYFLVMLQQLL